MNGATAELSATRSKTPNNNITRMIGSSQNFFLTRRNSQSSFKSDMMKTFCRKNDLRGSEKCGPRILRMTHGRDARATAHPACYRARFSELKTIVQTAHEFAGKLHAAPNSFHAVHHDDSARHGQTAWRSNRQRYRGCT